MTNITRQHTNAPASSTTRLSGAALIGHAWMAKLRRRSDFIAFALIAHSWGLIFAAMVLFAAFPNPLTFVLAVMIIGARQLGLAVLMHDAAHNALFKTTAFNSRVSDALLAWPMLTRTDAYRRYHLQHHARTQQVDDPDLVLSAPFPITRKSLRRKIIRDLTGQTGYQQRKAQIINAFGDANLPLHKRPTHFWIKLGPALVANLTILAVCSLAFHWSYYLMFWVLPLLTYHMAITRLRNIAEHAIVPDNNDPFRNARTTRAGPLARVFLAPYWVNYHVEHHLLMHVPCYRLGQMHKMLIARGYGPKMEIASNYFDVLVRASARTDDEDTPGTLVHDGRRRANRVSGTFGEGFSKTSAGRPSGAG